MKKALWIVVASVGMGASVQGQVMPAMPYQPGMPYPMGARAMMGGRAMYGGGYGGYQVNWDEMSDEDAEAYMEGAERGMGMMPGDNDPKLQPKTELGKKIKTLDFTRTPQTVLAARAKLAAQRRAKAIDPNAPEEEPPESGVPGLPPGMMDGGEEMGDGGDGAAMAAAMAQAMAMARAQGIAVPGMDDGGDGTPAEGEAAAGAPAGAGGPDAAEKAKKKAEAAKEAAKKAARFRLLVVAGEWDEVGKFIKEEGGEDQAAIYSMMLTGLAQRDQALVPGEVIAISEVSPGDMTDKVITKLGEMLKATQRRGSQAGAVGAAIKAGTTHFGGNDPLKRKQAASLLVAAGLPVEAQTYLPPMSEARAAGDADLLNLYAVYFAALAKEKKDQERAAAIDEGWRLCGEVLAIPTAKAEQRSKAVEKALVFLPDVPADRGDAFLASLFAGQPDVGWIAIDRAQKRAEMMRMRQAPPEERVKSLMAARRVGRAILEGGKDALAAWRTGLDMLTLVLLEEAEDTRMHRQNERMQFISPEKLAPALPDAKWLTAIDPGLAAKLELMAAATAGGSGDVQAVLDMIRPIAASDHERALKLGEALLTAWPNFVRPRQGNEEDVYGGGYPYRRYGGYNPYAYRYNRYGYGGGGADGAIPLTRAKQQRNLEKLAEIVRSLDELGVGPLPTGPLVEAFAASHSDAEVFTREAIEREFGAIGSIGAEPLQKLAESMRQRLATVWRNPQVQQEAGTKRTDTELAAEVVRGYDLALGIAHAAAEKSPQSWEVAGLIGDLSFDKAEFLYGQKAELAVYAGVREEAFAGYARAAELYKGSLEAGKGQPTARVYTQWFASALGASDLGYLTRQDQADEDQIQRVKRAIDGLGEPQAARHIGLLAADAVKAVREMNPELKARYLRHAVRIIGQSEQGKEARAMLAYYEDLQKEVELTLAIDGPAEVGHSDSFGATLSIVASRAVARESGGFSKYLQNDQYNPTTGQPVNYKDDLEKKLREVLGQAFEVQSITFHKPTIQPVASARTGWEEWPVAYLLLKAKDASIDRVPPVQLDMDFSDGQGLVILPITSQVVLISAREDRGADRVAAGVEVEQTLDDRKAAGEGVVGLEIRARGRGLLGPMPAILAADLSKVGARAGGFEVVKVEDHGLSLVDLDTTGSRVIPVTERVWDVRLRPPASGAAEFTFPAARVPGAKVALKRYSDADVVDTKQTVAIAGRTGSSPWLVVVPVGAVAVLAAAWAVVARRRRRDGEAAAAPRFTAPAHVTPVNAIALLRRMEAQNGTLFGAEAQAELSATIGRLEERYFAPHGAEASERDLRAVVEMWVGRATSRRV